VKTETELEIDEEDDYFRKKKKVVDTLREKMGHYDSNQTGKQNSVETPSATS
jgi:hypothetical protein